MKNSDLSSATWTNANFSYATLTGDTLTGVDWSTVNLAHVGSEELIGQPTALSPGVTLVNGQLRGV